ncbi:D-aminoacyl-tRNA deacylase [Desulfovibrio ferrophilus]|uniref:D-aminoacyl-tRNA deacylase n=1 Tax=Desulfovibrio ferrophilus TaxID=241368 RepID=A0A2Z6B067_9BACT|nr:D-aminoacyl-tRNA deacylase [Desulfovibrio ferrophilus]BBD08909.1 D-tyrosyl-tRNA(Tyr) deacylase [Desulfovibrio ferrophilus]
MRLHLQRVRSARVDVDGKSVGEIGTGLLVLAGFSSADGGELPTSAVWKKMLSKVLDLRVFPDEDDKLNLSLKDFGGELLMVSQFTLYADCKKGRRPSFHLAANGEHALGLYDRLLNDFEQLLPGRVQSGAFGEMMDVSLTNWGPVTILLDSADF